MNIIAKRSRLGLAAFVAIALTGCGGSGSDPVEEGMGVFNLSVSDSGIKDAAKVCIKFDGVQLKKAGEDAPITIDFDAPQIVNLLANQGANSQPITSEQVPAGDYEWIRLMVDANRDNNAGTGDTDPTVLECLADDGSYLLTKTSVLPYSLFIPSGDQSGLKLIKDITIPVNASGNYTAEWDLGKSFIAPPGLAPDVMMKPVVKLVANNEVGTLVGQVANGLVEAESCDTEFAPKVYVFNDGVAPNPINYPPEDPEAPFEPDPNDPVATGLVDLQEQDDGSMQYRYSIGFLLAGTYDPAFTCDGETFVLPLDDQPEALIEAGQTTTVNFEIDESGG
jgi:hypothetical protein